MGNISHTVSQSQRRDERIAKGTGFSYKSLHKLEQVAETSKALPDSFGDLLDKIDNGMKIDKAWKLVQNHKKRADLKAQSVKLALPEPDKARLILGDFREKGKELSDSSVDLIFSDPPYDEKSLHLYDSLASDGYRVLKAGGSLVTYAGHYAIPQIIQYMHRRNLQYYWIFAVIHNGPFSSFFAKNILVKWKPLLWFVKDKGEKPQQNGKIFDLINSTKPAKILHDWEQSPEDARYVIGQLTKPGDTVLDPFMGSGTTGIAALNLKRHFFGIEINPESFELAKLNIAKHLNQRMGLA